MTVAFRADKAMTDRAEEHATGDGGAANRKAPEVMKRLFSAALSLVLGTVALGFTPAQCGQERYGQQPNARAVSVSSSVSGYRSNLLLVRPAQGASTDEISDVLEEVHGTVVGSIFEGSRKILIIQTEEGKLAETEARLRRDKHFSGIQRNHVGVSQGIPFTMPARDPAYCQEWHLGAMHVPQAWQLGARGAGMTIGVFDTGCSSDIADLNGKTDKGCDAVGIIMAALLAGPVGLAAAREVNRGGQSDWNGHGTEVATTAAARSDNDVNTAGVAPDARIAPVVATLGVGSEGASDITILEGLQYAERHGIKIINISSYQPGALSFANRDAHSLLHDELKVFHDVYGGLAFFCAGNYGSRDNSPRSPYLIMVSGLAKQMTPDPRSNYGPPVWFIAPSEGILCSDKSGKQVAAYGTSFAAPICAAVAALVWGANPGLRNTQVEQILINSCTKPGSPIYHAEYYGYGMPDAEKAVKMALGLQ
ncbi:MAG TPA: S8 family serine peptidase [Candidatus Obscuribacterales bacterium]